MNEFKGWTIEKIKFSMESTKNEIKMLEDELAQNYPKCVLKAIEQRITKLRSDFGKCDFEFHRRIRVEKRLRK